MALVVGILLIAAVLVAVALFAAGRIDGMSEAVPDAPPGLADGPVTAEGLRGVRLPVSLRGYRMADVDELIERAAAELAAAAPLRSLPAPPESTPRIKPSPYATPSPHTEVMTSDEIDPVNG
jgi:DivIVA domain-containing protein